MSNAILVGPEIRRVRLPFAVRQRALFFLAALACIALAAAGLPTLWPNNPDASAPFPGGDGITSLAITNSAQRMTASFGSGGATVSSDGARFTLGFTAFGRGARLQSVAPVQPQLDGGMVRYAYPVGVAETWRNQPGGLEQAFVLSRRPAGNGPVAVAMTAPATSLLLRGAVLLPGGLRYAGLRAVDARGRVLHSWLALVHGRLLIKVADRRATYPVRIDPIVEQANLTPPDGAVGDYFGSSVAVSGHTLVAGAPYHHSEQGAVYVFSDSSGHWKRTAELTVGGKPDQSLGAAVAISGNTLVASAPYAGTASQGALYVFRDTSGQWKQVAELTTSDAGLSDQLGRYSVAIQGTTIVAGSPAHAVGSVADQGAVYVFNEPAGGWATKTQSAELTETGGAVEDFVGWSVGISGNTIVAGAPGRSAAFVFSKRSGHWKQTAKLQPRDAAGEGVGHAVAISGPTIAAAAASNLSVFHNTKGKWKQTAELSDTDGAAVAFSGGAILATVASLDPTKGGAYLAAIPEFREFSGRWRHVSSVTVGQMHPNKQEPLTESLAASGPTVVAGLANGDDAGSVVVLKGRVTSEGPLIGQVRSGVAGQAKVPVTCELPAHSTCQVTISVRRTGRKQVLGHAKPKKIRGTEIRAITVHFNAAFEHLLVRSNGVKVTFKVRETSHGKLKASGSRTIHFTLA
jgi:hypothetical protein